MRIRTRFDLFKVPLINDICFDFLSSTILILVFTEFSLCFLIIVIPILVLSSIDQVLVSITIFKGIFDP